MILVAGAILLELQSARGSGIVIDCTETALRAAMGGGGVVTFACEGTITLTNTITITNDTALEAGGRQVTVSGNGAVRLFFVYTNVQLSIDHLIIANGFASNGAALLNAGGTVKVTNSTFCGNYVLGSPPSPYSNVEGESVAGGAVANQGVLHLSNCTFSNNTAAGGPGGTAYGGLTGPAGGRGAGGAIWNSGLLLASGCTFSSNSAAGGMGGDGSSGEPLPWPTQGYPGGPGGEGAGGVLFNLGTTRLINCTLAFNRGVGGAGGPGGPGYRPSPDYPPAIPGPGGPSGLSIGGIENASGPCYLTNCTIVFNSGTGISTIETNGVKLINTLLAGNLPDGNGSGTMMDFGHNLSSDVTCAFTNVGSMNNIDPGLGALANNGGPTLTMALLPGSSAIDGGDDTAASAEDQRGLPRPIGPAVDIGAFEYGSPALLTLAPSPTRGFDLVVIGKRGQACRLLASEGLINWQPIFTNQFGSDGTVVFHETAGPSRRFYRVLLP